MLIQVHLALVMASLAAWAAERPTIGLLTEFPTTTSAELRNQFRHEAEKALISAGVDLAWRDLQENTSQETFDRLVVIRFKGACTPPAAPARERSAPLGLTHVSNERVLPFVEIDCARVIEAMNAGDWPSAIGRALGRVAAHEIFHVLTASGAHDTEGLMRPAFDRRVLLCQSAMSFSPDAIRRLRISLGIANISD